MFDTLDVIFSIIGLLVVIIYALLSWWSYKEKDKVNEDNLKLLKAINNKLEMDNHNSKRDGGLTKRGDI